MSALPPEADMLRVGHQCLLCAISGLHGLMPIRFANGNYYTQGASAHQKCLRSRLRLRLNSATRPGEGTPRIRKTSCLYLRQGARKCRIVIMHGNLERVDEQDVRLAPTGEEHARELLPISRSKRLISYESDRRKATTRNLQ